MCNTYVNYSQEEAVVAHVSPPFLPRNSVLLGFARFCSVLLGARTYCKFVGENPPGIQANTDDANNVPQATAVKPHCRDGRSNNKRPTRSSNQANEPLAAEEEAGAVEPARLGTGPVEVAFKQTAQQQRQPPPLIDNLAKRKIFDSLLLLLLFLLLLRRRRHCRGGLRR
jgi:hypothetical protein